MAYGLESAGNVAKRVSHVTGVSATVSATLKAFFKDWAANHGNADLQFVPYIGESTAGASHASGQDLAVDGASRVYAFYGKKTATAEDVYLYLFDDTANDAGGATDARAGLVFLEASAEAIVLYPTGLPMAAGIVAKAYTDFDGTTDSTDGACGNGFVIIGVA